jgi:RNA polymerase sigma-70 factor (ECF subfamily)
MAGAAADDADAWEKLVAAQGGRVWKTIRRLLGDSGDCADAAADCFQETFLEFFDVSRRTRVNSAGALLVRIATRRAIDRIRRRVVERRRRPKSDSVDTDRPSRDPGPADHAAADELQTLLRDALGELDPEQTAVFCLTQFEQMSNPDVAELLGLRVNHVAVLLHRARRELAARLNEQVKPSRRST